jgi:hypothetical protein
MEGYPYYISSELLLLITIEAGGKTGGQKDVEDKPNNTAYSVNFLNIQPVERASFDIVF